MLDTDVFGGIKVWLEMQLLPNAAYRSHEESVDLFVVVTGLVSCWSPDQAHLGSVRLEPCVGC